MVIFEFHVFAPDGSYRLYSEITEFGRHYSSYIVGMHVRASFLAFSYWLSTINCHAWTRVAIYCMLIGRGRGRGRETRKTMSWHMAALCMCHALTA